MYTLKMMIVHGISVSRFLEEVESSVLYVGEKGQHSGAATISARIVITILVQGFFKDASGTRCTPISF